MRKGIGVNTTDCIWNDINVNPEAGQELSTLDFLAIVASLGVNLIATLMIAYRAWYVELFTTHPQSQICLA
jgi:hypothetical protein